MATFYPSFEKILKLKVQPESGELFLLNFLKDSLDDTFEIYFQSFLNGDRPDVIIMRRNYGVFIIEVKDWNLNHYYIDQNRKWRLRKNHSYLKSPVDQVLRYKENMFNLHIPDLLEKKIIDFKYWKIVFCGVYFHHHSAMELNSFIVNPFKNDFRYQKFLKWNIELLGRDNLNKKNFERIIQRKFESNVFTNGLYNSFRRYLQPVQHTKDQGKFINFSTIQKKLIVSSPREQRIKGVMGSGKTTILAYRAVDANRRTGEKVLILTYNITLKNFIHDKINSVPEDFILGDFQIDNYHGFITKELNNLNVDFIFPDNFEELSANEKSEYFEKYYYSNLSLFEEHSAKISKYFTILIDEIQDYSKVWMDIIKKYFLVEGGEYVLFGDEKQNIFGNKQQNKDIVTNIQQRPTELKDCFRSEQRIKDISIEFQKIFFQKKYNLDDFNKQLSLKFDWNGTTNYIYLPSENSIIALYNIVHDNSNRFKEHPNDVTVLGLRIDFLRKFDFYYRMRSNEKTSTMFETEEIRNKVFLDLNYNHEIVKKGVNLFDKSKILKNDIKRNKLAVLITLQNFYNEFGDDLFKFKLNSFLNKFNIKYSLFDSWYCEYVLANFTKQSIFSRIIKNIRENKKYHFWPNPGTLKLSTIHSFKGWEENTVFCVIEPDVKSLDNISSDELIYTGMTRCRKNLVLINYGNKNYDIGLRNIFSS
ncbi:NERD domain-containing protein [uncultured Draconibacterium sp.]|uniref:NERD domain-containing protein n=1 Tax=uncultured Draconibacterium sp. TaxID=1573823 RepID=UPI003217038B